MAPSPRREKSAGPPEAAMLVALRAEHRHIAAVMALLSQQLNAIERGDLVDTHVLYEIMDYMVTWPDRFHHPREDLIYDHVAEVDQGMAGEVRELERDHDHMAREGREVLYVIERWRAGELSGREVVDKGRGYVRRAHEHMNLEEDEVFPLIDAVLTRSDWRDLEAEDSLNPAADPVFGRRVQREFRHLARKVRRSLRHGVEQGAVIEWVGIEALLESWEVMTMAWQGGATITGDHLRSSLREATYIVLDRPLQAPLLCAANNARLTLSWLEELSQLSRDTVADLTRVNRERKDRLRLLRRAGAPR
ncbi:hemerythrin domain-containing protein [Pseudohaliea rubra]|uniref:Hemerythrin-like domain-containing protein n=1 Tax=Pseudohaliea rubra DSM 19751 TaxID=1265313 RepID=A0A095VP54_9GAMM|nr:hemerythrin domain-containing protein [Pseudohaliea rubra]KGE03135.1 hypothetical protein HRUBRA_02276 [Pseudohaliea rubra DSM 19751]